MDPIPTCTSTPKKTPCKETTTHCTPGRVARTPGSTTKTPKGDRFIPIIESDHDLDVAHFFINQDLERVPSSNYVLALEDTLFEGKAQSKILTFKPQPPPSKRFNLNPNNLYSSCPSQPSPNKKAHRHIRRDPERILDAPNLANDYYLNVLDWSSDNIVAVGLGTEVCMWNASTAEVSSLPVQQDRPAITSVTWARGGYHLAVGTDRSTVEIWDVVKQKRVREMEGHSARVGVLAWDDHMLSSGSRDSNIVNHDVRIADHHVSTLTGHTMEVCGLKWKDRSPVLASGGNDNMAYIWDVRSIRPYSGLCDPLYSLPHMGAVKGLAWCPFQPNLLATGAGSTDRSIRFWSSSSGALLRSVQTQSQVCQILWSNNYKELVSAHGFSQNHLTVWKYTNMTRVAELTGHQDRVLYLAMSPDGETCVSGGGDENLRFWKIFERGHSKPAVKHAEPSSIHSNYAMIR